MDQVLLLLVKDVQIGRRVSEPLVREDLRRCQSLGRINIQDVREEVFQLLRGFYRTVDVEI